MLSTPDNEGGSPPPPSSQLSDETTSFHVCRAVKGDRESLGWVVARLSPLLKAQAAYRVSRNARLFSDVDDIVAEAWLIALQRLDDIRQWPGRLTPKLVAFLSTTILNLINHRLDASIRKKQVNLEAPDASTAQGADPLDQQSAEITGVVTNAARGEISAAIENCLAGLSEQDRQVVVLRGIEGLSNQEAAREMGELPTTVSHRYRRTLQKLRNELPDSIFDALTDG